MKLHFGKAFKGAGEGLEIMFRLMEARKARLRDEFESNRNYLAEQERQRELKEYRDVLNDIQERQVKVQEEMQALQATEAERNAVTQFKEPWNQRGVYFTNPEAVKALMEGGEGFDFGPEYAGQPWERVLSDFITKAQQSPNTAFDIPNVGFVVSREPSRSISTSISNRTSASDIPTVGLVNAYNNAMESYVKEQLDLYKAQNPFGQVIDVNNPNDPRVQTLTQQAREQFVQLYGDFSTWADNTVKAASAAYHPSGYVPTAGDRGPPRPSGSQTQQPPNATTQFINNWFRKNR